MTAQPVQPLNASDLVVPSAHTPMDKRFFDNRFLTLMAAVNGLIAQNAEFAGTENTLVSEALVRLNTAWQPLLTQLQQAVDMGFLVAQAVIAPPAGPIALTAGNDVGFILTSPVNTSGLSVFQPTTYVLATDDMDPGNWGILKVLDWTESTNNLACNCIYATQTKGSTSWTISDNAAVLPVMIDLESQTQAYAAQVATQYANVLTAIDQINALVSEINAGPAVSVCGYQGIVVLGINDITGLTAQLATKATITSMNAVAAAAQPLSSVLTSLAGLGVATNNLIYATANGVLGQAPLTAFSRTLLAQIDLPNWMNTLGITTFGRTIIGAVDSPSATTAMGALNVADKAGATEIAGGTDNTKYATVQTIAQQTANLAPRDILINDQITGFYTLQAIDKGYLVRITSGSPATAFLPNNLPVGWNCLIEQGGPGQIALAGPPGTTVTNRLSQFKTAGQYAVISLYVRSNSTGSNAVYNLTGDTSL